MTWLLTNTESLTGQLLYSDWATVGHNNPNSERKTSLERKTSCLNDIACIPGLGIAAGVTRIALAALHILVHLLCTLVFMDLDHLKHVVKGGAELLRGIIESIPIIGNIFAFHHTPGFLRNMNSLSTYEGEVWGSGFFLVKIVNPEKPDDVDRGYYQVDNQTGQSRGHPFFDSNGKLKAEWAA